MNRLRNRLILVFAAATLAPLCATVWLTASLVDYSLRLASTRELDTLSRSLELTGRSLYQQARESLRNEALSERPPDQRYRIPSPLSEKNALPLAVNELLASGEQDKFVLTGNAGNRLDYLLRRDGEIRIYSKPLGAVGLSEISAQHAAARALVERAATMDFRRGITITFALLAAVTWLAALIALTYWAHRISHPIQRLTAGLSELASGNLEARLPFPGGDDEISAATRAFNRTAEQLQHSRDRLVYLTRLASWQALARKMAHEVKNSLTPIRLTMEELVARRDDSDRTFLEQAAQIVVEEVNTLERRVRAFSEFAAEPPVHLATVEMNALVEERIVFLRHAHPEVVYDTRLANGPMLALADEDLIKGVLTNLFENAAQAAGHGGTVLGKTLSLGDRVAVEIHDSGPGLSSQARDSLFEPTISFKKSGMGLGLSIAQRGALLSGGDILLVEGELGGAAFRVLLPAA